MRTQLVYMSLKSDFRFDVLVGENWNKNKLGKKILIFKPEVSLWDLLAEKDSSILKFILKQFNVLYKIVKGNETLVLLILSVTLFAIKVSLFR